MKCTVYKYLDAVYYIPPKEDSPFGWWAHIPAGITAVHPTIGIRGAIASGKIIGEVTLPPEVVKQGAADAARKFGAALIGGRD